MIFQENVRDSHSRSNVCSRKIIFENNFESIVEPILKVIFTLNAVSIHEKLLFKAIRRDILNIKFLLMKNNFSEQFVF